MFGEFQVYRLTSFEPGGFRSGDSEAGDAEEDGEDLHGNFLGALEVELQLGESVGVRMGALESPRLKI